MASENRKAKREEEDLKMEELIEDMWRDFYDSKCKLLRSRKSMSLDELFFMQEG
ncbi:MAG: hypothetical protein ACXQTI_04360 [Candidatus Nezhaarchaeales archaeon]